MVELKLLRQFQCDHSPEIHWDDKGRFATLHWTTRDGEALHLTVPATELHRLPGGIAAAIERQPQPNRHP